MDRIYDFNESVKLGESGEEIIKKWLLRQENIQYVEDVSKIKQYQDCDVDFIIYFKNGTKGAAELKTDYYDTGNMAYETLSNIEKNIAGCMRKSKAKFLLYFFIKKRKLYIIDLPQFREWCESNLNKYRRVEVANKSINGGIHHAENRLIKLADIEDKNFILGVKNI